MTEQTLFESSKYRVDFFGCAEPGPNIIVSFTEFQPHNRTLSGKGFGSVFALENGIDAIAVKSSANDWYHDFPDEAISNVREFLKSRNYQNRTGYGSSMGGYAAILFAKALGLTRVLALSPQFDIGQPWDRRWESDARRIGSIRPVTPEAISDQCHYFVLHDAYNSDSIHADELGKVIGRGRAQLSLMNVPYGGHPVGPSLNEAGILQPLALRIMRGAPAENIGSVLRFRGNRPAENLFLLAIRCLERNKPRSADAIIRRALQKKPLHPEYNIGAAHIALELGDLPRAISYASLASTMAPDNPHIRFHLGSMLEKAERYREALFQLDAAVSLLPSNDGFRQKRDTVAKQI